MTTLYVITIFSAAAYMFFLAFMMQTNDSVSSVIFKLIPFIIGTMLLMTGLLELNIITLNI